MPPSVRSPATYPSFASAWATPRELRRADRNDPIRGHPQYDPFNLPGSPGYAFYKVTSTRAFDYGPDDLTATRWRST